MHMLPSSTRLAKSARISGIFRTGAARFRNVSIQPLTGRLYLLFTFRDYCVRVTMLKLRPIILFALFLGSGANCFAADGVFDLRGEAMRGEATIHRFDYAGAAYEFRLVPMGGGWTIWIGDPRHRDNNYVTVATPPFRGINPAVIQGWHFRNADNTGPNTPGLNSLNAPQKERHFFFVRDEAGYQDAQEALAILLRPDGRPEVEIKEAESRLANVPRGEGTLWIEALELGNLAPGGQAYIERMAFRLRLQLP